MGFLLRWLAAFVLLAATYNPTELSYVRWSVKNWPEQMPMIVFLGLVLLIAFIVFFTAVLRGIGALGVVLILAVLAALLWVLYDFGWLNFENPSANTWIALIVLSIVLAVGMYWGILWRRISGQLEVDDEGQG
ncbi:MAG: DUF6524 family protein [Silicimonas sp.]|jgi:hypothetical protein|nr:DUF6524 family protein [Silicimonas sp.]